MRAALPDWFRAAAAVGLIALGGCSSSATVQGTVKLDGRPLPQATVTFQPVHGAGRSVAGVSDRRGRYKLAEVEKGENLVRIETSAFRVGPDGQAIEQPEILPPRYHAESTRTRQVRPGLQTFDFDLQSDGQP